MTIEIEKKDILNIVEIANNPKVEQLKEALDIMKYLQKSTKKFFSPKTFQC